IQVHRLGAHAPVDDGRRTQEPPDARAERGLLVLNGSTARHKGDASYNADVSTPLTARRAWLLAAVLAATCSGESSARPAAPAPAAAAAPVPPAPSEPANVAGTWTGTLEATGLAPRRITILAFQGGTCVDGAWRTEPAEWVGAISGYADVGSFSGS